MSGRRIEQKRKRKRERKNSWTWTTVWRLQKREGWAEVEEGLGDK